MKTLFSEISAEGTCICNFKKIIKTHMETSPNQCNPAEKKSKLEEQNPKIDTSDSDLDTDLDTDT